jgi:hypothetical protein
LMVQNLAKAVFPVPETGLSIKVQSYRNNF